MTPRNNKKKNNRRIPFGLLPYIVLFVFLFISLYTEIKTGESWFHNKYPHLSCPSFLRASAVLEVIKILGFSTILIGVIYSSLDKHMLGLSYSEILKFRLISYHSCSVAHILATILCVITSAAGISESAIITLIAVLYGFLYQWIAVYCVVLSSKQCEKIAILKWEMSLLQEEGSMDNLLRLAGTIPSPDNKHFAKHLYCLAITFINHASKPCQPLLFQQIANVWATIHELYKSHNQTYLITSIFEELIHIEDIKQSKKNQSICLLNKVDDRCQDEHVDASLKEKALYTIGCGYLIQRLLLSINNENHKKSNSDIFWQLSFELAFLERSLINGAQDNKLLMMSTLNCIRTTYSVLMLVYFQCGLIDLNPDMLALKPDCAVEYCVYDVVKCLFRPIDSEMSNEIKLFTDRALFYLR